MPANGGNEIVLEFFDDFFDSRVFIGEAAYKPVREVSGSTVGVSFAERTRLLAPDADLDAFAGEGGKTSLTDIFTLLPAAEACYRKHQVKNALTQCQEGIDKFSHFISVRPWPPPRFV